MERRIHLALAASVLGGFMIASPALTTQEGLDGTQIAASDSMARGADLTAEEIVDLERRVERNPWDLESRTQLIGHYWAQREDVEARAARRENVLWLIEHQPEAPILGLPTADLHPMLDGRAFLQAAALWDRHLERDADNLAILHNASAFYLFTDRELAIELLERASRIEPNNPRWRERIGRMRMLDARAGPEPDSKAAAEAVTEFESVLGDADETRRPLLLADAAEAAAMAEEWEKAVAYANELLRSTADDTTEWFYGNAVHTGNLVLGRVAFAKGDIAEAARFLVRAGETPGSPQLNTFGPSMGLARDLLEAGERAAVIEYLELCGRFWNKETVDAWVRTIEAGETPDFGRHLR